MVASRQIEIPFYRGVGRQRGREFGAFAEVIGRTAIPFLPKYIVPAAKHVGDDLLEFAVPEYAEVVIGRKNIKTAAKNVGRLTLRKQLGKESRRRKGAVGGREFAYREVAGNGVRAGSLQQNLQNKSVGRGEIFLQTFLINHVE